MTKRIAVFCGSNHGIDPDFTLLAEALGEEMASREIALVYGGGHVGLMGKIADAVLRNNGSVIGVIPEFMTKKELAHTGLTELVITSSMHERKAKISEISDAFIALPGGIGTLEELIEMYTWLQLRLINKPIAILNVNRFFNPLLKLLDNMVGYELLRPDHLQRLLVDTDPSDLLDKIENNNYDFNEKWYITK